MGQLSKLVNWSEVCSSKCRNDFEDSESMNFDQQLKNRFFFDSVSSLRCAVQAKPTTTYQLWMLQRRFWTIRFSITCELSYTVAVNKM